MTIGARRWRPLAGILKGVGVLHQDLYTETHACFLEVHVEDGDFGVHDACLDR